MCIHILAYMHICVHVYSLTIVYYFYVYICIDPVSPMAGGVPQLSSLMKSREPKEFKFTSVNFTVDNGK